MRAGYAASPGFVAFVADLRRRHCNQKQKKLRMSRWAPVAQHPQIPASCPRATGSHHASTWGFRGAAKDAAGGAAGCHLKLLSVDMGLASLPGPRKSRVSSRPYTIFAWRLRVLPPGKRMQRAVVTEPCTFLSPSAAKQASKSIYTGMKSTT